MKTVTYRAGLPVNPATWTLDRIRQFVADADAQGISGDTPVVRFPEHDSFAFQTDQKYYGLGVERVVTLLSEDIKLDLVYKCPETRTGCNCRGD